MEPLEILAIANGALAILKAIAPKLEEAVKAGQISVQTQASILATIDAIRDGTAFKGPEWIPSTEPPSVSPK